MQERSRATAYPDPKRTRGTVRRVKATPDGLESEAPSSILSATAGTSTSTPPSTWRWARAATTGRSRTRPASAVSSPSTTSTRRRGSAIRATLRSTVCRRAFDTAVALRDAGLHFVVAPLPTRDGESLRRLDSHYAIALFPFVEGEAGQFGYFEDDDDDGRSAVVAMLAELHQATAAAGSAVRNDRLRSARSPSPRRSTPGCRPGVDGRTALR